MLPEEFESPVSSSERQQKYTLDRSAIGIDCCCWWWWWWWWWC